MIVLDASVVIAAFEPADAHAERARSLLADTEEQLALSVITLAEVLASPDSRAEARVTALEAVVVPIGAGAGSRLGELRRTTRLKLPDCCVLLAAEHVDAAALLTFDERLADVARARGFHVP